MQNSFAPPLPFLPPSPPHVQQYRRPASRCLHSAPIASFAVWGSGGTGAVYLTERTIGGAVQLSATKILAPHAGGAAFVERFEREQRILASLSHPSIARVLDAGITTAGQSYLVMEYVDGLPLDRFCQEQHLSIRARIELIRKVCDAIDYAHHSLVVHLDLKPSNILVTPAGDPKLLDFGTSKFIARDGRFTATLMATPAYASPEQLRHEALTTASDIYSLGVVLSEILTGRKTSDQASAAVLVERAIAGRVPEPLEDLVGPSDSRLRATLSGDLSKIVAKCLAPLPNERFSSVRSLSDDLDRYLNGMPVLARPQTSVYRLSKFVRRNSAKVALVSVLVMALSASAGYAWWQQRKALAEGQRALRMQTFLYRLFQTANSNVTGKPAATITEFLRLGVKVLPQYIADPRDLRQAQLGLAESMYQNRDFAAAEPALQQVLHDAIFARDVSAQAEAPHISVELRIHKDRVPKHCACAPTLWNWQAAPEFHRARWRLRQSLALKPVVSGGLPPIKRLSGWPAWL